MSRDDVPPRFAVDLAGVTLLGIYRVDSKIADGGMGSVWLGEDTNLGRPVVVKVPHVRFLGEAGFRVRFVREIVELVRLEHPNIVRILAQGTHEDVPFFVLQYLGGGSLEERLAADGDGPRGAEDVMPWLRTIAATLDFVNGHGVVHRDVKPGNILFDEEGHVFLSDFGVVKALDEDLNVTDAGTGVGSPKYMSPEQAFGRPVDGTADQYGLATTVYEALAGRLPFEGDSVLEILLNKQKVPPLPVAEFVPDLPAPCAEAVMRALAIEPGERFPTCEDFADAFLAGAGIFDRTPPTGAPIVGAPRASRLLPAALVLLLAAIVLVTGFASGWFSPGAESRTRSPGDVVLLEAGAAPRRVLRYRPVEGVREAAVVDVDTRETKHLAEVESAEEKRFRISCRLGLDVSGVGPDGVAAFRWNCEQATIDLGEQTPPAILEVLGALAGVVEGRTGTGRQDARGFHRGLEFDAPPPEAPESRKIHDFLVEVLTQVAVPLPEEPVGVGALWEVTRARLHLEGIRIAETMTFEVESITGDAVRLRLLIALTASKQDFESPEVPAAAGVRLIGVQGDGEGEVVVDLDRLCNRSIRMDVQSSATVSVPEAEGARNVRIDRRIHYEAYRK